MRTTTILNTLLLCGGLLGAGLFTARAADIIKADNLDNLNLGTSWAGGVGPSPDDIAVWNNVILGENTTTLGASLNWLGFASPPPAGW